MSAFDKLVDSGGHAFTGDDGKSYTFIDADTIDTGEVDKEGNKITYRLAGTDAPETDKVFGAGVSAGEVGGMATTQQTVDLANSQGFTQVRLSGEEGKYGRKIFDLINPETGESFSQRLTSEGIQPIFGGTSEEGLSRLASKEFTQALKTEDKRLGAYEETAWDKAKTAIDQAVGEETVKGAAFKRAQKYSGEVRDLTEALERAQADGNQALVQHYEQELHSINTAAHADMMLTDRGQVSGDARNPLSTAWNLGLNSATESAYGMLNMLGVETGNEWLTELGEDGVIRAQNFAAQNARIVTDYTDVEDFGSFVDFVGNNIAMSLPYMGITVGAGLVGAAAAPVVGGIGATTIAIGAPAAIYAGQTWNEMEGEKDAKVAVAAGIAQATLDRLGLDAIFAKGIPAHKLMKQAKDALVKKGYSAKEAGKIVADASKQETVAMLGDAAALAKNQLKQKDLFLQMSVRGGMGAGGEALTEAGQEAIGYLGAQLGGSESDFNKHGVIDFAELNKRMVSAAIAGGTIGGFLATPGAINDHLGWAAAAGNLEAADASKDSLAAQFAAEEKAINGRIASNEENLAEIHAEGNQGLTHDEWVQEHHKINSQKTFADKAGEALLNLPGALIKGQVRHTFTPDILRRSRSARKAADLFGGNLQRVFSGATYENAKHHAVTIYKNMVKAPDDFYREMTGGQSLGFKKASKKGEISRRTYDVLNKAVDKDGNFDPNLIPENTPNRQTIINMGNEMIKLGDQMHKDQSKWNKDLGYVKNYLFGYKAFNKGQIKNNQIGFQKALQSQFGYSPADAKKLTDEILDNVEVNDINEAFSTIHGGIVPQSHRKRSLNLASNKEFQEFMEQDIYANMSTAAKSAARYDTQQKYMGKNSMVMSNLLNKMKAEGLTDSEVARVAKQMKDYFDAESGNYKRPQTEIGRAAQRLQKNFMMYTTLAGLPLATISSLVETAIISKGLRKDQIFGEKGSLQAIAKEGANTIVSGMNEVVNVSTGTDREAYSPYRTGAKDILKDLGYYDWDVGAATTTGVSETNPWHQQIYEGFFKWTGLSGYTNFTRAARASIAGDYIIDKAEIVSNMRLSGQPETREAQAAEEGLRNLGIDVDGLLEVQNSMKMGIPLTPEQEAFMADTMRDATFNFVNEAIALPQAANRPLIYQDPRFALFTQFQGFMATFTANHLPKLWGEYVKRGTPAMRQQAFYLMATMIMMGFISQHLKDQIKYDQDDEDKDYTFANPYLDTAQYAQRGVRASGLLGTGERVLDLFFPLYESRSNGVGDWVWTESVSQSPALSNLGRIGKAGGKLLEGDTGEAARNLAKSSPFVGPLNRVTTAIGEAADWNYKGE